MVEHRRGAQRRKGDDQGDTCAGHAQPPLTFRGGNRQELPCTVCSLQRSHMEKVELRAPLAVTRQRDT